jgi:hypothetical protein
MTRERYEAGLAGMFEGEVVARSAIRWKVFYWCTRKWSLLPADLSGAHG